MKNVRDFKKTLLINLLAVVPVFAHAGGAGPGGGKFECEQYVDLVGRVASAIAHIGQAKFDNISAPTESGKISVGDILNAYQKLVCKPIESNGLPWGMADRDAASFPNSGVTKLVWSNWHSASLHDRIRLSTHELAVLSKYERDGQYRVSGAVLSVLNENDQFFGEASIAEKTIHNKDGSVTLLSPYIEDENNIARRISDPYNKNSQEMCEFFGMSGQNGPSGAVLDYTVIKANYADEIVATIKDSHLTGFYSIQQLEYRVQAIPFYPGIVSAITCNPTQQGLRISK
jgi:hypothetical protein